jgi:hypothetical protein
MSPHSSTTEQFKDSKYCKLGLKEFWRFIQMSFVVFTLLAMYLPTSQAQASSIPKNQIDGQNQAIAQKISNITTNASSYPNSQIPRYEKYEISFSVETNAANLQLPFDSTPPPGIASGSGISVDALFTPDNWQTIYKQPAFYYQSYDDQIKSGKEWFYPTGGYSWKVRFTPNQTGTWQFKLSVQDSSGTTQTSPQPFFVAASTNKGFLRVSQKDSRYFEFEDGTYFPGLEYNMNFNHVDWNNPVLDNQGNFQKMSENGIQMVRLWLSEWSIFGSAWSPWNSIDPDQHSQYIPYNGASFLQAYPGSDISMEIDSGYNPCMFLGFMKSTPAVKENTTYRVRIRYKTTGLSGPRVAGKPYGLAAKTGGWLYGDGQNCNDSGSGAIVTSYQSQNSADFQILEGSLATGNNDFLPDFYLVMENVNSGKAYIDYVWIEENLGNGTFGPNILSKPWMAQHLYMDQRQSYAFDKVVDLAAQNGIYLRPVILEKNDPIFNEIDFQGNPIPEDPRCWDSDPNNDPAECPSNDWFYGNWRQDTKVRWLQQAWWRYLQARWGYSTNIQSWELLNEGDPYNGLHYTFADEFGKYMHQFKPDEHMVSTSFWNSFPKNEFWANPEYQNVDFADVHQYIGEDTPYLTDTAAATLDISMQFGAKQPGGAGKPVIRGETGFINLSTWQPTTKFQNDSTGNWLHNFIWGGINAGGLIESYWFENVHIYQENSNGTFIFDNRPQYRAYYNFINQIPLNNGFYQDAQAQNSNPKLRILGQKDLRNGRAHLWIQNLDHTWINVANGISIQPISSTITLSGFLAGNKYNLQWCDPYQIESKLQAGNIETLTAQADGSLKIMVANLTSDIAVKITPVGIRGAFNQFLPILAFK